MHKVFREQPFVVGFFFLPLSCRGRFPTHRAFNPKITEEQSCNSSIVWGRLSSGLAPRAPSVWDSSAAKGSA